MEKTPQLVNEREIREMSHPKKIFSTDSLPHRITVVVLMTMISVDSEELMLAKYFGDYMKNFIFIKCHRQEREKINSTQMCIDKSPQKREYKKIPPDCFNSSNMYTVTANLALTLRDAINSLKPTIGKKNLNLINLPENIE